MLTHPDGNFFVHTCSSEDHVDSLTMIDADGTDAVPILQDFNVASS